MKDLKYIPIIIVALVLMYSLLIFGIVVKLALWPIPSSKKLSLFLEAKGIKAYYAITDYVDSKLGVKNNE